MCRSPYQIGTAPVPCNTCKMCRINRIRVWTHRLVLESMLHKDNCFATLTYDEKNVPEELKPRDYQLFIKKLRKNLGDHKIRYFVAGEYGEKTKRPHFHMLLFGMPTCLYGRTRLKMPRCCPPCDLVKKIWDKGGVMLGTVNKDTAAYTCGYVLKKNLTKDSKRLGNRYPEFGRMSLRPGIGADTMDSVAKIINQYPGKYVNRDVPSTLKHGKKILPLGRYLRQKIREKTGIDKSKEKFQDYGLKMRFLLEEVIKSKKNKNKSIGKILLERNLQKMKSQEALYDIYNKEKQI